MIIKNGSEKNRTKLKKGDRCVWFRNAGTVAFARGGQSLYRDDGDDKFLVSSLNVLQFTGCIQIVAEVSGLTATLVSDKDNRVVYHFE